MLAGQKPDGVGDTPRTTAAVQTDRIGVRALDKESTEGFLEIGNDPLWRSPGELSLHDDDGMLLCVDWAQRFNGKYVRITIEELPEPAHDPCGYDRHRDKLQRANAAKSRSTNKIREERQKQKEEI